MGKISQETFICLDCETTGLDPKKDQIIEVAVIKFNKEGYLEEWESLIDPQIPIPEDSIKIHHITDEMVKAKPKITDVLPQIFRLIGDLPIVGHGINFDVDLLLEAAKRHLIPTKIGKNRQIDTLRLARYYGNSPTNSLDQLCKHFNVSFDDKHRAMSDVKMNIEVFKHLVEKFSTMKEIYEVLAQPIKMKRFPLGKHKGRLMKEVPLTFLHWAADKDFDQDLLYTIRSEIKRRKRDDQFDQVSNPFSDLNR